MFWFKKKEKDINKEVCKFCSKKIEASNSYLIYRFIVVTEVKVHYIGMLSILNELGDYLMAKGFHLSASQVVLLRPDILKEFFMLKLTPEKVVYWVLSDTDICHQCFVDYKVKVPEI